MEIAIAIISVVITVLLWLFPPEPLRKIFRLNSIATARKLRTTINSQSTLLKASNADLS